MNFFEKISKTINRNNSYLCVGLDPVIEKIPHCLQKGAQPIFQFNKAIIDATYDIVCAYKPNLAFYEQYGLSGLEQLIKTVEYIPENIPIIIDGKRSDIGNTARAYAKALFDIYKADSVTINPLLGFDSVTPFLDYKDKCTFLLALTSNPGAKDFQALTTADNNPLYIKMIETFKSWNKNNNCGLVVGATNGDEISNIRKLVPDWWFLIPGVGTQGGSLENVIKYAVPDNNSAKIIINVSRKILYASTENDFIVSTIKEAKSFKDQINILLNSNK